STKRRKEHLPAARCSLRRAPRPWSRDTLLAPSVADDLTDAGFVVDRAAGVVQAWPPSGASTDGQAGSRRKLARSLRTAFGTDLARSPGMAPAQTAGGHHAHSPLSRRSERRQPEHTALYQVVARHWPAFREPAEEAGGPPKFVTTALDEYLRCGVLEHGFLRLACTSCGHERLVGFSCKRRGFCPSCLGRRMTDSALHLTESVFPKVMVRQWVCSLPWGLRALLGYDRRLCSLVLRAFTEEVQRSLKRRAKKVLGLIGVALAHTEIGR